MNLVKSQDTKSIHRNLLNFYTLTMKTQREIKETIPFTIATKRIKYLGINLPKETKDLYAGNSKTLVKEIKENKKQKDTPCSWIGRINIVRMIILPKAISRFNASPIKSLNGNFHRTRTKISQSAWKHKRPWIAKVILRKKKQELEEPTSLTSSYSTKLHVIKTIWYWHKNRHIDQWNKIESPEINPYTYRHVIFNKWGKSKQWWKDSLFNKWCWENSTAKEWN